MIFMQVYWCWWGGMKAMSERGCWQWKWKGKREREDHVEDGQIAFRKTWKRKGLGNNILKTGINGRDWSEMATLFETGKAQEEEEDSSKFM